MPLDGHAFLLAQGWSGTGNGLRKGAISRPITAPQKTNLAGIGKDRDDAFPFWDHIAHNAIPPASTMSIQIKDTRPSTLELRQTSTGILSNRPPVVGTPISSGAATPMLKRESARRGLYSRFFRGPILGPDDVQSEMIKTEPAATPQIPSHHHLVGNMEKAKKKRKVDARGEDTDRVVRKRQKREAERAARKPKRHKEKDKAEDRKDEDIANSKPADDGILSPSVQEQSSGLLVSIAHGEMPHARREKKKKKRFKVASGDNELDAQSPVSTDERTLEGEDRRESSKNDSSKRLRKRRRHDQS
ncbi:hypothetical protein BJV74DRAFT_808327 [Russula compacta]|nr:hypothetical protein BJV74DRAFT_808327 [Russula compacta]